MEDVKFSDLEIYKGMKFDALLKQIHQNANDKGNQINTLISRLTELVTDPNEAAMLVPLIVEYLDVAVKNDDQLIKMANVIQRFVSKAAAPAKADDSGMMTDAEKEELINAARSAGSGKIISMHG